MTAVEFLAKQALNYLNDEQENNLIKVIEQALEMEWQQIEKMYSEEDLQEAFYAHNQSWIDYERWFEQFKKK
jgi:hypothetical protein